jgi:hypothetical protein
MKAGSQRAVEQARIEPDRLYPVLFDGLVSELSELCRGSQNMISCEGILALLEEWTGPYTMKDHMEDYETANHFGVAVGCVAGGCSTCPICQARCTTNTTQSERLVCG